MILIRYASAEIHKWAFSYPCQVTNRLRVHKLLLRLNRFTINEYTGDNCVTTRVGCVEVIGARNVVRAKRAPQQVHAASAYWCL